MANIGKGDTPSKSRKAALYRRAARLIEKEAEHYACNALRAVRLNGAAFDATFKDDAIAYAKRQGSAFVCHHAYMSNADSDGDVDLQDVRVLALCFMAAITERP